MADYHFNVTQIKRSAGQSAVACAAYRAGEKLHSDYYGEDSDYTHKSGVIFTDILLPSHVPKEYKDREFLWNSVEKAEKHPKAQLAYSFDFSLQNEFSMEENLAIAREFILKNFVGRGMIADYAVHLPDRTDGGVPNPHVHVMCPIRPMEPDGTWGAKQHRVYRLDEDGNRIRDADGNDLFDARPTTDWGEPETLEQWRNAWAEINNAHFAEHGFDVRIDNRSFERQGIDRIPMIHEGPNVREMERRGIVTEKGERNRWIRQVNDSVRSLSGQIRELESWISVLNEKSSAGREPTPAELLGEYYAQRNVNAWSVTAKNNNLKEYAKLTMYLQEHGISTAGELRDHINHVHELSEPVQRHFTQINDRLKELDALEKAGERYTETKPYYDKWYGILFKKSKDGYAAEHRKELKAFRAARRQLQNSRYLDDNGNYDSDEVKRDREELLISLDKFRTEHKSLGEQVKTLNSIGRIISSVSKNGSQSDNVIPASEQGRREDAPMKSYPVNKRKKEDNSLE